MTRARKMLCFRSVLSVCSRPRSFRGSLVLCGEGWRKAEGGLASHSGLFTEWASSPWLPGNTQWMVCRQCSRNLTSLPGRSDNFEKENILTVPNLLSLSRIALSPVLGYLVLMEKYGLAFGLFALASVTDLADGYIARTFKGQSSMLGAVLDPLADKCLVAVLCVSLTMTGLIPLPLTAVILARDGILIAGSFYLRYITLPSPRTWSRYWDIKRATVQVTPSLLGKVNTLLQLLLVGLTLGAPLLELSGHSLFPCLWLATGATTAASGVSYVFKMGGFKVLKKKPP